MTITDGLGLVHDIRKVHLGNGDTMLLIPCAPFTQPEPLDTEDKPLTCLQCVALSARRLGSYSELVTHFGFTL